MRISLIIALGLMACFSDKDGTTTDTADASADTEADTDTDTDADADADADADMDCNVDIDDISPRDNESGVYYKRSVEVLLDGDDSTATIAVSDGGGNPVAGVVDNSGDVVSFTADPNLVPDSEHTITFTWCGGEEKTTFQTSELGLPLEADLTGTTFALDLGSATWDEPAGLGDLVSGYVDISLLVGVQSADTEIDFIGAMGADGGDEQDMCLPTIDFDPSDFSGAPDFLVGPEDLPIAIMEVSATVFGMEVGGTIAPDGSSMGGVVMKGAFDIAEIGPALGGVFGFDLSDPDVACGTIAMLGIICGECPHKEELHCLSLHLSDIDATRTGDTIVEVPEAYCHEDCATRDEHPECDEDAGGDTGA